MARYEGLSTYDRTKDKTIDICLNCKKKVCYGECKRKHFEQVEQEAKRNE